MLSSLFFRKLSPTTHILDLNVFVREQLPGFLREDFSGSRRNREFQFSGHKLCGGSGIFPRCAPGAGMEDAVQSERALFLNVLAGLVGASFNRDLEALVLIDCEMHLVPLNHVLA